MRLTRIMNWLAALAVMVGLAACGGGGGDAGTPLLGGGSGGSGTGKTGPSLTMALSSSTITPANSAVLTVTARDAKGLPIAGRVVDLKLSRGGLASLGVTSVATGADGSAKVGVFALTAGVSGADEIVGTLTLDTTTVSGTVAVTVAGSAPTLNVAASTVNLSQSTGPATISAILRDATGAPVPNVPVAFSSQAGNIKLAAASVLTDVSGVARVLATPANPGVSVADSVVASASLQGSSLQGSVPLQVLADVPRMSVVSSASTSTTASPATLTVTVLDALGAAAPAGTLVEVRSTFGLSSFDAATVATNAAGKAQVQISPKSATSNGADQIVFSTSVGGVGVSASLVMQVSASGAGQPTITVTVNPGTLTADVPATATVVLKDARGVGIAGKVIDLSTLRGNLAVLSRASVTTGANGEAVVTVSRRTGGAFGADDLVASATVDGVVIKGQGAFTVNGSVPVISAAVSGSGSLVGINDVRQLTARLLGLNGLPAANVRVVFGTQGGLLKLSATAAVTDATGTATVSVSPADGAVSGVETLTVSATVGGLAAADTIPVQVLAESPQVRLTSTPNNQISAAQPGTVRATVSDTQGNPVPGVVVSFTAANALTSFSAATAVTDATGAATVVAMPRAGANGGADEVTASTSVRGVRASGSLVLQVLTGSSPASAQLDLALGSPQISSAAATTATATLKNGRGEPVGGQVITFSVVRGLARTNVATALTDASGVARVVLSPSNTTTAGADELTAAVNYAGQALLATKGFEVQASNVTLVGITPVPATVGAYGQANLRLSISGASPGSPVNVAVTSTCQRINKATISPSSFTATSSTVDIQYKDNGCGGSQAFDTVRAEIVGSSSAVTQDLGLVAPSSNSIAFMSASPEVIFIKGSGFAETSTLVFEVRDTAGNVLPNKKVWLRLLTESGGVTLQGASRRGAWLEKSENSDAGGRVAALVNAGTQPTPVRVMAYLDENNAITTVSSNLSIGVGLPSQLNFSLAQATLNIEGFNIDGTANTYSVIASDRSGNPVAAGTAISFVTEGGQIEASRQISLSGGTARAQAQFVSSNPRPADGRVTVVAYALGEESFIDLNGNNVYDAGEPFQELGRIHKDRDFNGVFDATGDEYVPTGLDDGSTCNALSAGSNPVHQALLALDASIPSTSTSAPSTCDGVWSGSGKVYVRRAVETVLSTSAARPLWASKSGLAATSSACVAPLTLQVGPSPATVLAFNPLAGDTWYFNGSTAGSSVVLPLIVADANTYPVGHPSRAVAGAIGRLNPMAAGTRISASTPTPGVTVTVVGGSPVASTTEASSAAVSVGFAAGTIPVADVLVTFISPSGVGTTYAVRVDGHRDVAAGGTPRPASCP